MHKNSHHGVHILRLLLTDMLLFQAGGVNEGSGRDVYPMREKVPHGATMAGLPP